MRIGIDIDGVLTDVEQFAIDYISKYCVENNIKYNIGKSSYHSSETFNISKEYIDDFWDKNIEFYAKEESIRLFASEVIKKLKDDGNEIYIITARWRTNQDDEAGRNMREIVKKWLFENNVIYDKLIFSKGDKEEKIEEVTENKIDIMIEDSPKNTNELSNIIPVICYDAEYNKECVGENIIRCYSWYDIYSEITKIKQKEY